MYQLLKSLDESGNPIRVAIIGCGRFGSMIMSQIKQAPGMMVAVACDTNLIQAWDAIELSGYQDDSAVFCSKVSQANQSIQLGKIVVTDDQSLCMSAEIDVVVEATGNPVVGTHHALSAIKNNKHIIMVNVEADALVGPALKRRSDEAGVVYSLAYGDQPAIIGDMYDWGMSMGFEIVAAGKGTKYIPEYRYSTPDDSMTQYGHPNKGISTAKLNNKMYNSFLDGTKSAVEMCSVSNMTGLLPDIPGMHFPAAAIEEIPGLLCPQEDGGILSRKGAVEIISSVRRDGTPIDNHLRWGVYVVITSENKYLRTCMSDYGMAMDLSGRYAVMYRPYHLVGMETPVSIARAHLYGEATGAPAARLCEVAATAKTNLNSGESLDGEGGYTVYGTLVECTLSDMTRILPIGLSYGAKLKRSINQNTVLTYSDVELSTDKLIETLRQELTSNSTMVYQ